MKNHIERVIDLPAPIERVWHAITDPVEVSQWFGDIAEIHLEPGGEALFGWSEYDNRSRAVVVAVDEPGYFAYRWAVDSDSPVTEGASTLVEFHLESRGGATRLRLVESGFASLSGRRGLESFESNDKGWTAELEDLAALLEPARQ